MATRAIQREPGLEPDPGDGHGFVDRVLLFVDRLPGPAAAWWLAIGFGLAAIGHVFVWLSTNRPLGVIHDDVAVPAFIFAWFGWLTHTLNGVGRTTFDEFRPALGDVEPAARFRDELTSIPDRYAIVAAIAAVAIVSVAYYVGVRPLREAAPPEIELVSAPLWGAAAAALGIVVLHTVRQLRIVSRLSAIARNVDIFNSGPINAFSRLTAVSAIGLILFVVMFVLYTPTQPIAYIVQEAVLLLVAVTSFVWPLRVMHARLVAEKQRLLLASQERLKTVLDRLHDLVDSNDLA